MRLHLHWPTSWGGESGIAFTAKSFCGDGCSIEATGRVIPFGDHSELNGDRWFHVLGDGRREFIVEPGDKLRTQLLNEALDELSRALAGADGPVHAVAAASRGFTARSAAAGKRRGGRRRPKIEHAAYATLRAEHSHLTDSAAARVLARELDTPESTIRYGFKSAAAAKLSRDDVRQVLDADGRSPREILIAARPQRRYLSRH